MSKLCYEVAKNIAKSKDNSLDMAHKLYAINLIYTKTKLNLTFEIPNNEGINVATENSNKELNHHVVRGKRRLSTKRKIASIEKVAVRKKTK